MTITISDINKADLELIARGLGWKDGSKVTQEQFVGDAVSSWLYRYSKSGSAFRATEVQRQAYLDALKAAASTAASAKVPVVVTSPA